MPTLFVAKAGFPHHGPLPIRCSESAAGTTTGYHDSVAYYGLLSLSPGACGGGDLPWLNLGGDWLSYSEGRWYRPSLSLCLLGSCGGDRPWTLVVVVEPDLLLACIGTCWFAPGTMSRFP
jgi:hypothetical protein